MGGPGAVLLARAAELLGVPKAATAAEAAANCGLLDALAAGGVQGVLVCARRVPQAPPPPPPQPPAERPALDEPSVLAPASHDSPAAAADKPAAKEQCRCSDSSNADAAAADGLPPAAAAEAEPPSLEPAPAPVDAPTAPAPAPPPSAPAAVAEEVTLHAFPAGTSLPAELAGCPTVHLVRTAAGSAPLQLGEELEAGVSCTLLPGGPSLASLHQLLALVVAPWLAAQHSGSGGEASSAAAIGLAAGDDPAAAAAADLLAASRKLAAQAAACAKHLHSEVAVALPSLPPGLSLLGDPAAAAASEEAVLACERCMEEWVGQVAGVLQREGGARPAGRGPLAELDLWRRRADAYGALLEQLGVPAVCGAQAIVERGSSDANLAASFRGQLTELARLALEARDNARFLLTLERHFRAVEEGGLAAAADALQPMLNALRMIWCVSRHYGDDVHMSGLLERVATALQDRLDTALDISALFRAPPGEARALVGACRALAQGWQAGYLANRERIEASGHHARWEFSRHLLFERTNHAAEVCAELEGMLQATADFRAFLGPELQAVTGDAGVIGEVSDMAMVEPVESLGFNPLDPARAADWRTAAARFARDADDVELATRDLIDTCFRRLRSVDAAAELLHSFQRIHAQGAMQQQMADKLAAIQAARRQFEEGRDDPPLTRNQPPVAGAIRWSRTLLARLRHTWVRLQGLGAELEALEPGRRAAAAMTGLARSCLAYEKGRFAAWAAGVDATVAAGLQQPLLVRAPPPSATSAGGDAAGTAHAGGAQASAQARAQAQAQQGPVVVNFAPGLLAVVREAKYLDQLGYSVPRGAANLALQEGQLREHCRELGAVLERHAAAGSALRPAERALLGEQLAALGRCLDPGLARLNWASLTIPDFVAGANRAVDQFEALAAQVQKSAAAIDRAIWHIGRGRLVPPDAPARAPASATAASGFTAVAAEGAGAVQGVQGGEVQAAGVGVPDLQEFYEDCEQHRQQVVAGLVARYRCLPPLLVKLEELVVGTSSGKAPRLAGYYAYLEKRLLSAISGTVVAGLQALHDRLRTCAPAASEGGEEGGAPPRPPLFRVSLSLLSAEVLVSPSTSEASKQLGRLLRNLVESARPFVRWMHGTCVEAPEQHVYGEDAEPFVFSYFADVSQSPSVIRAMLLAQHEVQRTCAGVGKAAERWRAFAGLGKADRAAALAKLRSRKPSLATVEEAMGRYHAAGEEAWAAGGDMDVGFVRVRCAPLAAAVRAEAQAWVRGIGEQVLMADAPQPAALRQQAANLLASVQLQAAGEADVPGIQAAIASAQAEAPAALAACADLQERCRIRRLFCSEPADAEALQAELAAVDEARAAWQQLAAAAAERQAQGVSAPPAVPAADDSHVSGEPSEGSSLGRRPSQMRAGSAARLGRTASSVSSASSSVSRGARQPRGPSRARPADAAAGEG